MEIFVPLKYTNLINYSLFINTVCQMKCQYCYARKIKKWNQILSLHDIKYIINHLKKSQDFSITILGGEPTLHKNLNEILLLLISMDNCKVIEIFTNGMKLVKLPESDKIKVFISYHHNDCVYSAYDHYKNFDCTICVPDIGDTIEIMSFIYKEKIKFHIQYVVDESVRTPKLMSNRDSDVFLHGRKQITLDYIINNKISFRGCLCEQRYYLLEKDHILDECNHKSYSYNDIQNLKLNRVCEFDSCFKNGDFLLYNRKFLEI